MNVDFDQVAATYDARYEQDDYAEVATTIAHTGTDARRSLEVGCGTGHWLARFQTPERTVFGIDPSTEMLRNASAGLAGRRLAQAVAEALPFSDRAFDFVFAINALHHFASLETFVSEAARVLRPGGRVATVGLDPSTGTDQWYVYDYFPRTLELDRDRYPRATTIAAALESAGFEGIETRVAQHLPGSEPARAYLRDTLHRHITSQLSLLTDAEYQAGIDRIERDILAGERSGQPALLTADLRLYVTEGRLGGT